MTEKPILFSTEMVRAIMAGIKSQTRRVMKPQPPVFYLGGGGWYPHPPEEDAGRYAKRPFHYATKEQFLRGVVQDCCPYGKPGETRLWVRETWAPNDCECEGLCHHPAYAYLADPWTDTVLPVDHPRWHPSIHMPRKASRLTLELTAVRVERLQDISDDDAFAEGVLPNWTGPRQGQTPAPSGAAFANLWDSINGPRGFGWDTNCYVWVLTFSVLKQETKT